LNSRLVSFQFAYRARFTDLDDAGRQRFHLGPDHYQVALTVRGDEAAGWSETMHLDAGHHVVEVIYNSALDAARWQNAIHLMAELCRSQALGIGETTAKTHLQHIFAKTATSKQTELMQLFIRSAPPVQASQNWRRCEAPLQDRVVLPK